MFDVAHMLCEYIFLNLINIYLFQPDDKTLGVEKNDAKSVSASLVP